MRIPMNANAESDGNRGRHSSARGKVSLMLAVACELSPDIGKQYEEP
jgi:hypothetical protein